MLEWQIEQRFHEHAGQAVGNFAQTLLAPQTELVQQSLKDPYVFEFLTLAPQAVERDIENQLVAQITRFPLEPGKGFASLGLQCPLAVNGRQTRVQRLAGGAYEHPRIEPGWCRSAIWPPTSGDMNFRIRPQTDTLVREVFCIVVSPPHWGCATHT